jgi:transposase InsO family protein
MPWETTNVIEGRIKLVMAYLARQVTMTSLCIKYAVSRKTAYKWVAKYLSVGLEGLGDRSRAPRGGRHWTRRSTAELIVELRRAHPRWGARKILARLEQRYPKRRWPGDTTAHDILRRAGLVKKPRTRARWREQQGRSVEVTRPNALWTIDFKGQFRTLDGRYCYPLTVVDAYSRKILGCFALASPTFEATWAAMDKLFSIYGLPDAIHSDNGEPFASRSPAGISRLSVRFIRLGIRVERSRPGKPQDNGSHERMHRTLKEEATNPPEANLAQQQIRFDAFVTEFNDERPHEAHGQRQPSRLYRVSRRLNPRERADPQYPATFRTRRVTVRGNIKWNARLIFISEVLISERVGLVEDDGQWLVYFGSVVLGRIDARRSKLMPTKLMSKEKP